MHFFIDADVFCSTEICNYAKVNHVRMPYKIITLVNRQIFGESLSLHV